MLETLLTILLLVVVFGFMYLVTKLFISGHQYEPMEIPEWVIDKVHSNKKIKLFNGNICQIINYVGEGRFEVKIDGVKGVYNNHWSSFVKEEEE